MTHDPDPTTDRHTPPTPPGRSDEPTAPTPPTPPAAPPPLAAPAHPTSAGRGDDPTAPAHPTPPGRRQEPTAHGRPLTGGHQSPTAAGRDEAPSAGRDGERVMALGRQLIETHAALLDALDRLRDGALPAAELAVHCVAFCAAVTTHHTGEDDTVFPELAARHPELRDLLSGLRRDHEMIATILRKAATLAADLDAAGTRGELEGWPPSCSRTSRGRSAG